MLPPVVAEVVRNGFVESRHRGTVVALSPDGAPVIAVGDVTSPVLPRSCLKPLQAAAMLASGWSPAADADIAIAAASHSGEAAHVDVVRRILADAGLDDNALDNTAALPLDVTTARAIVRSGGGPDSLHHNCSGKHAAMLATCVARGWPTAGYRDPDHPVQRAVASFVETAAGETIAAVAVDGCGAPVFAVTLTGLGRAFSVLATAPVGSPGRRVIEAMRAHAFLVGGTGRDVTALMGGVHGLAAKDGAEGMYVAVLADGSAVALKIEDGSARARVPVVVAALRVLGVAAETVSGLATVPVLGHGDPVGVVRATPLQATRAGA